MAFTPLLRALAQLDDPNFVAVLLQSLAWTVVVFAAIFFLMSWGVALVLPHSASWAWVGHLLGGVGAILLTFWLFLPVAVTMAALYIERVARAVEQRFYPDLLPCAGAPLAEQIWDGLAVGLRVLLMSCAALVLTLLLPGIGALLGWAISGWAIGRGLFVAVAMRRMSRAAAKAQARRQRGAILIQGGILALAGFIPPLNFLVPVLGVAAMVHLLQDAPRRD
jgi:uncharacterized protein involved in cysteine biosynthesis